jgi:hypothetical protein
MRTLTLALTLALTTTTTIEAYTIVVDKQYRTPRTPRVARVARTVTRDLDILKSAIKIKKEDIKVEDRKTRGYVSAFISK